MEVVQTRSLAWAGAASQFPSWYFVDYFVLRTPYSIVDSVPVGLG